MIRVYKNTIFNVFDIVVLTVNFKNTYIRQEGVSNVVCCLRKLILFDAFCNSSNFKDKRYFRKPINLGVKVVLVLKRRIINEMMTTYLPTVLILIIVYSTNFFKHFFFEAVVTVNLTALLVLTTLFISVSG